MLALRHPARFTATRRSLSLIYRSHGDPLKVCELSEASVSPDQGSVKLRMLASPINPADINQIQGVYPKSPALPAVGGNEGVAEVLEAPERCGLAVGQRVIFAKSCLGTWQEHVSVNPDDVMPVYDHLPVLDAATLGVNPCTAYRMLHDFKPLTQGCSVVQNGATSAVGLCVIQLAAHMGIPTLNVIRDRPDYDHVRSSLLALGASEVVREEELEQPAVRARLKAEFAPSLGLNCVGGRSATNVTRLLCDGGALVTYGGMSKKPVTVPTGALIFNDVSFHGFWMTRWNDMRTVEERLPMLHKLQDLILAGALNTRHRTHELRHFADALTQATQGFRTAKDVFVFV